MPSFSWLSDETEALKDQAALRELVQITPLMLPEVIRGFAIGTAYNDEDRRAVAVGVSFRVGGRYEEGEFVETQEVDFPYVPGLLAYRVGPAVCNLLDKHADRLDLLVFDGQGIAHPRGIGLAAHIGA